MIKLNLLPPIEQKNIQYYLAYRALIIVLVITIITSFLSIIISLAIVWWTTNYVNDINIPNIANQPKVEAPNNYNQIIKSLSQLNKDIVVWPELLQALAPTIPEGVVLTDISIDIKKSTFKIDGTARDRQSALLLTQQLGQLAWIKNISSPLANLLTSTDIKFSITADINNDKLPKL